jgi:hypothetical protein
MEWLQAKDWHNKQTFAMQSEITEEGIERYGIAIDDGDNLITLWFDLNSDVHEAVHAFNYHTTSTRIPSGLLARNDSVTNFWFSAEDIRAGNTSPRWYFKKYDGVYDKIEVKLKRKVIKPEDYVSVELFGEF